jgi:hypothetical protein
VLHLSLVRGEALIAEICRRDLHGGVRVGYVLLLFLLLLEISENPLLFRFGGGSVYLCRMIIGRLGGCEDAISKPERMYSSALME